MLTRDQILNEIIKLKAASVNKQPVTNTDKLCAALLFILSNQSVFQPYLLELNEKIKLKVGALELYPAPTAYVAMHAAKFPAAPKQLMKDGDKLIHALDTILLEQEQKHGVNLGRTLQDVPVFVGQVSKEMADDLVARGDLWKDNGADLVAALHGSDSHRRQHYIITRFLEDNPDYLKDIFPQGTPKQIFSYLVPPKTNYRFQTILKKLQVVNLPCRDGSTSFSTYTRDYWGITLDNDRFRDSSYFIRQEPNLTAPVSLVEYCLSAEMFATCPYLASTSCHLLFQSIATITSKMQVTLADGYEHYQAAVNEGGVQGKSPFGSSLISGLLAISKHEHFISAGQQPWAGIIYQKSLRLRAEPAAPGFFSSLAVLRKSLCEKYGVVNDTGEKAILEKMLRNAAVQGNVDDLQVLLEKFKVNPNAQDSNKASLRTAMHWAIIKANDKPANIESYQLCITLLEEHGASYQIKDAFGKTADDYNQTVYYKKEQNL